MKNQRTSKKPKKILYLLLLGLTLLCCGCGREQTTSVPTPTPIPKEEGKTEIVYRPGSYDSLDTAVIVAKNEEEKTITLLSTAVGKKYTLQVEGTSTLYDKHGSAVSLGQMKEGDIVEVTFLKDIKRLNSMQLCPEAWANASVGRYEIDWKKNKKLRNLWETKRKQKRIPSLKPKCLKKPILPRAGKRRRRRNKEELKWQF